jgi:hypothetical protein
MSTHPASEHTTQPVDPSAPKEQSQAAQPVPIEVKWNLPAWMLTRRVAPHMRGFPREDDSRQRKSLERQDR